MRVPLDYTEPARGEVSVALLRVSAELPAQRLGAILFNPGGPGGDGLFLAPLFAGLWSGANPASASGKLYKQMSQAYDLIGFSPRGTGNSTRLYCGANEPLQFVANPVADRRPENIAAMHFNAKLKAQACLKNPLTPFINTDATARDMDMVRHLLGDEKLNYYGASYGTWLGSWYASLFPQRVGRMLLTGVVDLGINLEETFLMQGLGYQRVLDDVLAPYAARHNDLFGLGTDALAVRQIHRALPLHLQDAVSERLTGVMGDSTKADEALATLRAAKLLQGLIQTHPAADEKMLADLIAGEGWPYTAPVAARDQEARVQALAINTAYQARLRREASTLDISGGAVMYFAIACNDTRMRFGTDAWVEKNTNLAALYPLFGGSFTEWPCLYWSAPPVTRPALALASQAGGIVMLQTQLDARTPLEGALRSFAAMPNASLVQVDGEYNHGLSLPYQVDCVDIPLAEYFLTGKQPVRHSTCTGKPLAADASIAATAAQKKRANASTGQPTSVFNDPVAAARLLAKIQNISKGKP
jgi:pimeloyl-ACP methyl ester carboxylesterase